MDNYSLTDYVNMTKDNLRMDAYIKALKEVITKDSVVLDLGAGTGVFSLLACKYGAKKVYAIEPNDSILILPKLAKLNGCFDKIECIKDFSTNVNLDEKVDVIISDLRGSMPIYRNHIDSLNDAKKRFLKDNGCLIPKRDKLYVTVVQSEDLYLEFTEACGNNILDLNLEPIRDILVNLWRSNSIKYDNLLTSPEHWATLNYWNSPKTDIRNKIELKVENNGIAHGFFLWFDAELTDSVSFSCGPGAKNKVYGSAFFPFQNAVKVEKGERISIDLSTKMVGNDYVWNWNSCILKENVRKISYQQSTFYSGITSLRELKKRSKNYTPQLNSQGLVDQKILSLMREGLSLSIITEKIYSEYPDHFKNSADALAHIGNLSDKYSI